jgi:peptide/nickel transport system permease protein
MLTFLLRRLLAGVAVLVALCGVAFALLYLGAADTARTMLGPNAPQDVVDRKTAELGLDRPLAVQFGDWAMNALQGDLGRSWFSGELVTDALLARVPVTLSLTIGAVLLSGILAVVLGALAAGRGGAIDRVIQVATIVGSAIPGFLVALLLTVAFAINLRLFPATGYIRPEDSLVGWLSTITLPIIALAIGATASVAQQVRGSMVDALQQDYVRTLHARGLPVSRVVYRHVLRNAAGPALTVLGLQFVVLFGGAVIVEQVFSLPGLGQRAIAATAQGDVPIVMGLVIVTAVLVVVVNLAVDLLQAWLNPKVRLS